MQPLTSASEEGAVAVHLVLTVAFALFAVTQLTRTAVATRQIDVRVQDIVTSVDGVETGTEPVAALTRTDSLTSQILSAAAPLSAQAEQVADSAASIDKHVKDIAANATSIYANAKGINASAQEINSSARAVNAHAVSILAAFQHLAPVVVSFDDGIAAINERVDTVVTLSRGINSDAADIMRNATGIRLHAGSIDCSRVVNGSAC